jgi:adenylylsulfate kinase
MNVSKKYSLFIGRWQPFHNGHKWLFDNCLKEGKNILIAIRDIEPDENQPLFPLQVKDLLETVYKGNDKVKIIIIPDIESVNYGRGVGYQVNEYLPNTEIGSISATKIRELIRNKDDSWKNFVDSSIHSKLETLFSRLS